MKLLLSVATQSTVGIVLITIYFVLLKLWPTYMGAFTGLFFWLFFSLGRYFQKRDWV